MKLALAIALSVVASASSAFAAGDGIGCRVVSAGPVTLFQYDYNHTGETATMKILVRSFLVGPEKVANALSKAFEGSVDAAKATKALSDAIAAGAGQVNDVIKFERAGGVTRISINGNKLGDQFNADLLDKATDYIQTVALKEAGSSLGQACQ